MRDWTPRTPPRDLVARPVEDAPRWRAFLGSLGYLAGELGPALTGQGARPPAPGLVEAAELRVAELERGAVEAGAPLDADGVAAARAAAVVGYLEDHPPARARTADARHVELLDPAALGRRLVPQPGGPAGVQLLEDLVTGRRWWTVGRPGAAAGLSVVAGVLYRAVGVAAPAARLAQLGDELRAVCPELVGWAAARGAPLDLHRARLAAERPADAWLGWSAGVAGVRLRARELPAGMAQTLRWDLGAALGQGRAAPTWGIELAQVRAALAEEPAATARAMVAAAEAVAAIPDDRIRAAVALGRLEERAAAGLAATLIGRRDLVAAEVRRRVSGAPASR